VVVFSPCPLLTITIERRGQAPELHLHAGGQGFWIARMTAALGLPVSLCTSLGGETGNVVRALMESEGVQLRATTVEPATPSYVHDRRSGQRATVVETPTTPLSRHDVDELYSTTLAESLGAAVCVLAGPPLPTESPPDVVPVDTYRRLAADLSTNGGAVIADLSRGPLAAALDGGVTVAKLSDEQLASGGWVGPEPDQQELLSAMHQLQRSGAEHVVVSRAPEPTLALIRHDLYAVRPPTLKPIDDRGAGDSMTAGLAVALGRGDPLESALRLGVAAGALNVTRRGLATGSRAQVDQLEDHVELELLHPEPGPVSPSTGPGSIDRSSAPGAA
jgi:1-phosphofructokinase